MAIDFRTMEPGSAKMLVSGFWPTEALLTLDDSHVMFSLQYGQSWSHCGHMTICPPIWGSHTSLLNKQSHNQSKYIVSALQVLWIVSEHNSIMLWECYTSMCCSLWFCIRIWNSRGRLQQRGTTWMCRNPTRQNKCLSSRRNTSWK